MMGMMMAGETASADIVNITTSSYSTIYSGTTYGNNTNGGGPVFFCGGGPQADVPVTGWHDRALISFDVASAIPAGATITDVQLNLTTGFAAGSGGGSGGSGTDSAHHWFRLHVLTSPWGHDTVSESDKSSGGGTGGGITPTPGQHGASWNQSYYGQTTWQTAGGGGDFVSIVSASQSIGDTGNTPYTWASTPELVSDVQAWLDGTTPNYGWIMVSDDELVKTSFRNFWSSEGAKRQVALGTPGAAAWAPDLQITYSTVPEPMGLAGLASAVPLLLRRKRSRLRQSATTQMS